MSRCSPGTDAVCLLVTLREALDRHGEVVVRQADLPGLLGAAEYPAVVYLAVGLTTAQLRGTLAHELVHLRRGPVPPARAGDEEVAVRREAALILVPGAPVPADLGAGWTEQDIAELAARYEVDPDVAQAAVSAPTEEGL